MFAKHVKFENINTNAQIKGIKVAFRDWRGSGLAVDMSNARPGTALLALLLNEKLVQPLPDKERVYANARDKTFLAKVDKLRSAKEAK